MKNKLLFWFLGKSFALCILFSFVSTNGLLAEKLPTPFVILPQPQSVVLLKGAGLEPEMLQHLILRNELNRPVMGDILSKLTMGESTDKGSLTLILDKTLTSIPSDEGYVLTIYKDKAEISSKGEAGLVLWLPVA